MAGPDLWNVCVQLLWSDAYIEALESLLRQSGAKTILDCGGGTGYPAIELRIRGWDVAYVDRSPEMLEAFQDNCAARNVRIPAYLLDWLDLADVLGKQFDALLCRGNSLIYVGSWGTDSVPANSRSLIRKAIRQFYLSLNQGGLLYLDIIGSHEYDRPAYPIRSNLTGKLSDGSEINVTWEVSHNYTTRTRTWRTIVERDGRKYDQTYCSYLLRHEDVLSDLETAGFRKVESQPVQGESTYNVFLAYK